MTITEKDRQLIDDITEKGVDIPTLDEIVIDEDDVLTSIEVIAQFLSDVYEEADTDDDESTSKEMEPATEFQKEWDEVIKDIVFDNPDRTYSAYFPGISPDDHAFQSVEDDTRRMSAEDIDKAKQQLSDLEKKHLSQSGNESRRQMEIYYKSAQIAVEKARTQNIRLNDIRRKILATNRTSKDIHETLISVCPSIESKLPASESYTNVESPINVSSTLNGITQGSNLSTLENISAVMAMSYSVYKWLHQYNTTDVMERIVQHGAVLNDLVQSGIGAGKEFHESERDTLMLRSDNHIEAYIAYFIKKEQMVVTFGLSTITQLVQECISFVIGSPSDLDGGLDTSLSALRAQFEELNHSFRLEEVVVPARDTSPYVAVVAGMNYCHLLLNRNHRLMDKQLEDLLTLLKELYQRAIEHDVVNSPEKVKVLQTRLLEANTVMVQLMSMEDKFMYMVERINQTIIAVKHGDDRY